jgi:hypothetical protein
MHRIKNPSVFANARRPATPDKKSKIQNKLILKPARHAKGVTH